MSDTLEQLMARTRATLLAKAQAKVKPPVKPKARPVEQPAAPQFVGPIFNWKYVGSFVRFDRHLCKQCGGEQMVFAGYVDHFKHILKNYGTSTRFVDRPYQPTKMVQMETVSKSTCWECEK